MNEHRDELHYNGVHTRCKPAGGGRGDGTWRKCPHAGKVERVHGHDYEGPLVCCPGEVAP